MCFNFAETMFFIPLSAKLKIVCVHFGMGENPLLSGDWMTNLFLYAINTL